MAACAVCEVRRACGEGASGFEELAAVGGGGWLLHFGDLGAASALLRANYMAEVSRC